MKRSARRLLAASERFDEWESCVSWVPVTQYGDADGKYGYLFGGETGPRPATGPRSQSTAAIGTTRTTCSWHSSAATARAERARTNQERRSTDMRRVLTLALICTASLIVPPVAIAEDPPTPRDRVEELQQELDSLTEEIEDLQEPVASSTSSTSAVPDRRERVRQGRRRVRYLFGQSGAARRPGLALDIRGFGTPQYQFLAFPAEEPPSIECNEDAGQELIDN